MALETTVFDVVDSMTEPEDVFHHIEAEFEEYDPKYMRRMLESAIRARGGANRMASETGIEASELNRIASMDEETLRETALKLLEAYRPKISVTVRVA